MSLNIDSEALVYLKRILSMPGAGSSETVLDDGNVTQVLDILPIVRRSLTPIESGGIFVGMMENVHGGADDEASEIDPYAPGACAIGGYPPDVREGLDVWLLRADVRRTALAGELTGGQLRFDTSIEAQGWAIDDAAACLLGQGDQSVLAQWGNIDTTVNGGIHPAAEVGTGALYVKVGVRIRRGLRLRFDTTSAGAATFRLVMLIGLFPEALGQDAVT